MLHSVGCRDTYPSKTLTSSNISMRRRSRLPDKIILTYTTTNRLYTHLTGRVLRHISHGPVTGLYQGWMCLGKNTYLF